MFYRSDQTWVFDQSERAQGPIYILNSYKIANLFLINNYIISIVQSKKPFAQTINHIETRLNAYMLVDIERNLSLTFRCNISRRGNGSWFD